MTISEGKYVISEYAVTKDWVKLSFKPLEIAMEERIEELEKRIGELENEIDFLNYLLTKNWKERSC